MKHVSLGGLDVSRLGLGTMGMSAFYTGANVDDAESIRTIQRALDLGIMLIDTAEAYGPYLNEELVGQAIGGRRDQVVLATKFGLISRRDGEQRGLDSSPENVRIAAGRADRRADRRGRTRWPGACLKPYQARGRSRDHRPQTESPARIEGCRAS